MTCVVDFPLREEAVEVLDIDRCHKDRRSHSTLEVNYYFTVTHKLLIDEVNALNIQHYFRRLAETIFIEQICN